MGKNRNKNKNRRGGGKFLHSIEKQGALFSELNSEDYGERSLVKIDKNLGYGYFNVIIIKNGHKQKAYCRYMFTRRSPDYAIVEGVDDLQMLCPVANSCANVYISNNRFEKNISMAEGKCDEGDDNVSFYTEEELAELEVKKIDKSRKKISVEERSLRLKENEEAEKESVRSMIQLLVPKLEKKLEDKVEKSSTSSKPQFLTKCLDVIELLKECTLRSEAKQYYASFNEYVKYV